jgi:hypothetical protein
LLGHRPLGLNLRNANPLFEKYRAEEMTRWLSTILSGNPLAKIRIDFEFEGRCIIPEIVCPSLRNFTGISFGYLVGDAIQLSFFQTILKPIPI